jgi:hypothetical protein
VVGDVGQSERTIPAARDNARFISVGLRSFGIPPPSIPAPSCIIIGAGDDADDDRLVGVIDEVDDREGSGGGMGALVTI